MNKDKVINRLAGLMDDGVERMHTIADDLGKRVRTDASLVAERAKIGLMHGRERLMTTEQRMIRNMRAHPIPFLLAGLSVCGLILAKLIYDQTIRSPRRPTTRPKTTDW